jgi:hypothetical protein
MGTQLQCAALVRRGKAHEQVQRRVAVDGYQVCRVRLCETNDTAIDLDAWDAVPPLVEPKDDIGAFKVKPGVARLGLQQQNARAGSSLSSLLHSHRKRNETTD